MKRLALVFAVLLGVAGVVTASATATKPARYTWTYEYTAVYPAGDLCAFDVSVYSKADVVNNDYIDQNGNVVRSFMSGDFAGDVFTGPSGTTITGHPFQQNHWVYFNENGELVKNVFTGSEVVPLPDGPPTVFAGRTVLTYPDGAVVTHGTTQNLDGLCAALAP